MSAAAEISARLAQLAAQDRRLTFTTDHEPSMWLRGRLADLAARWTSGQAVPCPHVQAGADATAALWAPNVLLCAGCVPELAVTGDADRTCDRCGAVAARIVPHVVLAASPAARRDTKCSSDAACSPCPPTRSSGRPVLVAFGLCARCNGREMAA